MSNDIAILLFANRQGFILEPTDLASKSIVGIMQSTMQLKSIKYRANRDEKNLSQFVAPELTSSPSLDFKGDWGGWHFTRLVLVNSYEIETETKPVRFLVREPAVGKGNWQGFPIDSTYDLYFSEDGVFDQVKQTTCLLMISSIIAYLCEQNGGIILHGALAAENEKGVILAGRSGAGKTTCSQQLPSSWISLSDDTTLIMPGYDGRYWAYPWPSWGRFYFNSTEVQWDINRAIDLRGIYFLHSFSPLEAKRLSWSQSVSRLLDSANQVTYGWNSFLSPEETRNSRLACLDSVINLTRTIPVYMLQYNWGDPFWEVIEVL